MRRNKAIVRLGCLLLILLSVIALTVEADGRLRVLLNNYAKNKAKILSNSMINTTVHSYLESEKIKYSDILRINTKEDGTVTSVEFDTIRLTKLKSGVISHIQQNINKQGSIQIKVPLGTLTGNQFLNNKGPSIDIDMTISSAVYSKISSEFISAGINQTLHKIILTINTDIYFVMPWYRSSGSYQTDFVLAETVIVGEVPDAYTNVIEYPGSNIAGEIFDYSAEHG